MSPAQSRVADCRMIDLPTLSDARGALSFVEGNRHIPFPIARVFYLHGLPVDAVRGAHAHLRCEQFLVPMAGALDVTLDDGTERVTVRLSSRTAGLYVPPLIWATEHNFTAGTVCVVFASHEYETEDYVRDYASFLAIRAQGAQ